MSLPWERWQPEPDEVPPPEKPLPDLLDRVAPRPEGPSAGVPPPSQPESQPVRTPPSEPLYPDEEEPLPYYPPSPPNLPSTTGSIDFGAILKDAFVEALHQAGPKLKEGVKDYARDTIDAVVAGKQVDWGSPTITATTSQGKQLVVADAKSRSKRTFVQGLAIDLSVAIIAVVVTLSGQDLFQKETWILLGALLIKTVIQTVVAYFMRLKVTPTIKTPGEKMALMPVPRPMVEQQR